MRSRILKWGRWVITIGIIVGLVLFARTVNWGETWAAIRRSDMGILALAMIINLVSLVPKAIRWWIFLRPIGSPSFSLAMRATFAGAGLNNVLVANGGEAARVIFIARATQLPSSRVLATLALERLFEVVGYVVMLTMAVSFLTLPQSIARLRAVAWIALGVIGLLFVYLIRRPLHVDTAVVPASGAWRRAKQYAVRFGQTLGGISTPSRFGGALLLSIFAWAVQITTYHLTARAAGFAIPLVGTIACLIAVNVGFALRATPGNVGLFQMMYAVTAAGFGMDRDQAIAVAFLIQTQQIIPVTLIGLFLAPEFIFRNRRLAVEAEPTPGRRPVTR